MSRRAAAFTETDVKRAIKAVQAAGLTIGGVEIDRQGTIHIVTSTDTTQPENALQKWLAKNAR